MRVLVGEYFKRSFKLPTLLDFKTELEATNFNCERNEIKKQMKQMKQTKQRRIDKML